MGRLIFLDHNRQLPPPDRAEWVFSTVTNGYRDNDKLKFDIEVDYPHSAAIHYRSIRDPYERDPKLKLNVRRFVERRCEGDVIAEYVDLTYSVYLEADPLSQKRGHTLELVHGYAKFHFELDTDATLFALMFSDTVCRMVPHHPDHDNWIAEGYVVPEYYERRLIARCK